MSDKNYLNSGFSKDSFIKGAESMGGGGGANDPMSDAMSAGAASGFNPYVMAGAAVLSMAKTKANNERIQKEGEARADSERAAGEQKKSDILGQISGNIRQSLAPATQRKINL